MIILFISVQSAQSKKNLKKIVRLFPTFYIIRIRKQKEFKNKNREKKRKREEEHRKLLSNVLLHPLLHKKSLYKLKKINDNNNIEIKNKEEYQ